MIILLGNSAAKEAYRDPDDGGLRHRDLPGRRITTVKVPDTYTLMETLASVTAQDGAWNHHSSGDDPSDSTPDWVESDDDGLAGILSAHFGCPVGRPDEWVEETD